MQGRPNSKVVAAVAAVVQYLDEEYAAAAASAAAAPAPVTFSPWAVAGRQDTMLFRTLWQRRVSRSW